jgi:hypothetical protein
VLTALFDEMDKKATEAALEAPISDETAYGDTAVSPNPLDQFGASSLFGSSILKGLESVLRDRTMGIEFFHTEAKQLLVVAMIALQSVDEVKDPMFAQIFSNNSYVKADLYIDNAGKLRKTKAELKLVPPVENNNGVEEIKLTLESEHWNINEPINADVIDTTDSYAMDSISKPVEMLAILDKNSSLYHLLKDDLQITKKSIVLNMYDSAYTPYSMLPYIDSGVTMVPVRFISEQLDANVTFDQATHEVTITDAETRDKIILTLQSDMAIWNGKSVKLDGAVRNRDGTTYVPLKFIANALGAKVIWDNETKTITLSRD